MIPTHDRSDLIVRALRSVAAQTAAPSEVVVVDDASTEPIEAAVRNMAGPPARVIRRAERGGAAAARNTGIASAEGDILAFLDSDDEWLPDKLSHQIAYLDANPDVQLCCSGFVMRRESGDQVRKPDHEIMTMADLAFGCGLSPGTTLCVRRSLFDKVGPFDERMPRLEDWDWLIRATQVSPIGLIQDPLAIIHVASEPTADAVESAIAVLRQKHDPGFADLGVRARLKFRAALLNEQAVSSFRHRRYFRASSLFIKSMLVYPFRDWSYFVRISRRIGAELIRRP